MIKAKDMIEINIITAFCSIESAILWLREPDFKM